MPPPKKPKKGAPPIAEAPAVHDVELHTAARADGLDQGLEDGKRVTYAVRRCVVCEALVEEGFSRFPPENGRGNAIAGTLATTESPSGPRSSTPGTALSVPVDLEAAGEGIQALLAAAEAIKPGLGEKLVPFMEQALAEIAQGKVAEAATVAWRGAVTEDIRLLKEAIAVLHNNMSYLYRIETENVLVDLLRIKRALNIKPEG